MLKTQLWPAHSVFFHTQNVKRPYVCTLCPPGRMFQAAWMNGVCRLWVQGKVGGCGCVRWGWCRRGWSGLSASLALCLGLPVASFLVHSRGLTGPGMQPTPSFSRSLSPSLSFSLSPAHSLLLFLSLVLSPSLSIPLPVSPPDTQHKAEASTSFMGILCVGIKLWQSSRILEVCASMFMFMVSYV